MSFLKNIAEFQLEAQSKNMTDLLVEAMITSLTGHIQLYLIIIASIISIDRVVSWHNFFLDFFHTVNEFKIFFFLDFAIGTKHEKQKKISWFIRRFEYIYSYCLYIIGLRWFLWILEIWRRGGAQLDKEFTSEREFVSKNK